VTEKRLVLPVGQMSPLQPNREGIWLDEGICLASSPELPHVPGALSKVRGALIVWTQLGRQIPWLPATKSHSYLHVCLQTWEKGKKKKKNHNKP